jgi:putative transposase
MVSTLREWPWSSYRATAGEAESPPFLKTDWLLRAFADSRQQAVVSYRRFVAEGMGAPSPWRDLKNQIYLGSERFVERMQAMIDPPAPE